MAFMMPVVKNDWDIYHSQRTRRTSESAPEGRSGRARKISESRSEGPALSPRCMTPGGGGAGMGSPHRSAPTMRSASYSGYRAPPSRASRSSLRPSQPDSPCKTASGSPPQSGRNAIDKFHNRLVDKLKRALCKNPDGRADDERSSTQSLRLPERPRLYRPRLPSVSEAQPAAAAAASPPSGGGGEDSLRRRSADAPPSSSSARYYCSDCVPHFHFRRRTPLSY